MMRGYWYGPHMYGWGGEFGWAGSIVSVLFWIAVFILLMMLIKSQGKHHDEERGDSGDEDTALQILRERYAKGEITKRQFQDMRRDLSE